MGIKGLMKVLKENCPGSFKEVNKSKYNSKIIAIDASMQLYQFMIQVKIEGQNGIQSNLTDSNGEITSHLMGFFNRTINLLELGIKPVYVFDGKPPMLKAKELSKRSTTKKKAIADSEAIMKKLNEKDEEANEAENAEEINEEEISGDNGDSSNEEAGTEGHEEGREELVDEYNKLSKRSVHITKEQIDDVKKMLTFMGIPYIDAPCEAEAQCAELTKGTKVYASATEDMDCLTFGSKILLRNLTDSRTKNVTEIHIDKVLNILNITHEQFIDFCILCGCDYTNTISGIGPKRGLNLIREHKTIEQVIKVIKERNENPKLKTKHHVPEHLEQNLQEVRKLFTNPDVTPCSEINIVFKRVDNEELIKFLVTEKNFNKERIEKGISRIQKVALSNANQTTLHRFFTKA